MGVSEKKGTKLHTVETDNQITIWIQSCFLSFMVTTLTGCFNVRWKINSNWVRVKNTLFCTEMYFMLPLLILHQLKQSKGFVVGERILLLVLIYVKQTRAFYRE